MMGRLFFPLARSLQAKRLKAINLYEFQQKNVCVREKLMCLPWHETVRRVED
jgi:hypothetical protein